MISLESAIKYPASFKVPLTTQEIRVKKRGLSLWAMGNLECVEEENDEQTQELPTKPETPANSSTDITAVVTKSDLSVSSLR